jgi:hypothetical protein
MDSKTIIEESKDKIHTLVKEKYSDIARAMPMDARISAAVALLHWSTSLT